jgi:hypothetical protein
MTTKAHPESVSLVSRVIGWCWIVSFRQWSFGPVSMPSMLMMTGGRAQPATRNTALAQHTDMFAQRAHSSARRGELQGHGPHERTDNARCAGAFSHRAKESSTSGRCRSNAKHRPAAPDAAASGRGNRGKRRRTSSFFVVTGSLYHGFYHERGWMLADPYGRVGLRPRCKWIATDRKRRRCYCSQS